jgi:hypothetical protein
VPFPFLPVESPESIALCQTELEAARVPVLSVAPQELFEIKILEIS